MEKTDTEKKQMVKEVLYEYLQDRMLPEEELRSLTTSKKLKDDQAYLIKLKDSNTTEVLDGTLKSIRFHEYDGGFYSVSTDNERMNTTSFYSHTYGNYWYVTKK